MPLEPQEFACKPTTTSAKDLVQKEDNKKEYCTCEEGETSTEYAKKVCIIEPVKRLPRMLPTTGKNFIFKPIDPVGIPDDDEVLTISSDADLEERMLKLESKVDLLM